MAHRSPRCLARIRSRVRTRLVAGPPYRDGPSDWDIDVSSGLLEAAWCGPRASLDRPTGKAPGSGPSARCHSSAGARSARAGPGLCQAPSSLLVALVSPDDARPGPAAVGTVSGSGRGV